MVPVTPVISRVAAKDTTILDTFVPKGTKIFVSSYAIHHSRHFYGPNADTFDPGRWIDDDGQYNKHGGALDKYAFAAFGHGTRT
jgi:cytochrome P450